VDVLVVDNDRGRLARSCAWLLAKGYDVTTRSTGHELTAAVRELRPAMVFIDVLVPDLGSHELRQFLQHCHASDGPRVIVHSHLLPKILRAVVDTRLILGVVRPTEDPHQFSQQFEALTGLPPAARPRRPTSGTHRIDLRETKVTLRDRRQAG
jgi:CheY-like chemotaxis protein